MLIPVGSEGWYRRNLVKAEFDQLPVEAGSAVEALAVAANAAVSSQYSDLALQALKWYHGWCCVAWLIFFATFLSSLGKVLSRPSRALYASLHGKRVMQHSNGWNRKGVTLYDARSGACYDGISPAGLNLNKGA